MARNLITQSKQVKHSDSYDDQIQNVNDSGIAEPTVSGSLEEDFNIIRTLVKQVKGTTNWFDSLGTYFDPTSTASGGTELKDINLLNYKNNTLDSKTVIVPIVDDNNDQLFSITGAQTGFLLSTTAKYATHTNRTGIPIYSSGVNAGSYHDERGSIDVCSIDIVDADTDQSITTSGGGIIYGLFHDGSDFSGSGDGTDVYIKFYSDGYPVEFPSGHEVVSTIVSGTYDSPAGGSVNFDLLSGYTTPSGDALQFTFTDEVITGGIKIIYPYRKVMTDVQEYEWFRSNFLNPYTSTVTVSGSTSTGGPSSINVTVSGVLNMDVRQTVLSSKRDADGTANFISGVGSSSALIECATTPLVMTWANGYNTSGAIDYIHYETSDKSITTLVSGARNYIYSDYNSGSPIYGATPYAPYYSNKLNPGGINQGVILADFEGTNGDTTYSGIYGETFTFYGSAQISNTQYKFGSTSLRLSGGTSYTKLESPDMTDNWTIEAWFRADTVLASPLLALFCGDAYTYLLCFNSTGGLNLYISSEGSGLGWDIASGTGAAMSSTTFSANTWYHIAMQFDGTSYKVFVNGDTVINVSSTEKVQPSVYTLLGAYVSGLYAMDCYIDSYRFSSFARYKSSFITPTAQFSPDKITHFNSSDMRMYENSGTGWSNTNRLYLGEVAVGLDNVIDGVESYVNRIIRTQLYGQLDGPSYDPTNFIGAYADHYHGFNVFTDIKAQGTEGGGSTAGTYNTRTLNTSVWTIFPDISIASNYIYIPKGLYLIISVAPAYFTSGYHYLRIYNFNTAAYYGSYTGMHVSSANTAYTTTFAWSFDWINVSENSILQLRHYTSFTVANYGLGKAANLAGRSERYATLVIMRVGTKL